LYQFDWASKGKWSKETPADPFFTSRLAAKDINGVMLLNWQEHCIECAIPQCYSNCSLYVARADQECARFVYGIVRNPQFSGLMNCGADVRFRRWGKLEANITGQFVSVGRHRLLDLADHVVTSSVNIVAGLLSPLDRKRHLNRALKRLRQSLLQEAAPRTAPWDTFVAECFSFESTPFRLIVELRQHANSIFREGLDIRPGANFHCLPISLPVILTDGYRLMVYPDEDREARLVFTWLDFVSSDTSLILDGAVAPPDPADATKPADKVKCVAWDLDNTLWDGVLIEDGENRIRLRPDAVQLVNEFDKRGILQTIVSKNNHEEAMAILQKNGLAEFFLYPAINWGQKSASIEQIANRLNINIDTFALIDDSPFERSQVSSALPQVRVYSDKPLERLLDEPEFDVPVTMEGAARRLSYVTELERERAQEVFAGNYLDFLRSCALALRLFRPEAPNDVARCLELIQRSNQLNLSARRYDRQEFADLLADKGVLCIAMDCQDKFGKYGIVGFATIDLRGKTPVARDFVLSCRVAEKRVEHTFYRWVWQHLRQQGFTKLRVHLTKTARNGPLTKVFAELPFTTVDVTGSTVILELSPESPEIFTDVIRVDDQAFTPAGT
jgi:FkbH-like protein